MSSSSSSVSIQALLKKTEHYDKDERYMATSDLCEVLKRQHSTSTLSESTTTTTTTMDVTTEKRICSAVLRLLHDKSHDVQAIAVKTLGVLLTTVQEEQVLEIADNLLDQVLDVQKTELRDVYAIGLRTLCQTIPATMGDVVAQRLVGRLLEGIRLQQSNDILLCCLDILTDVLQRFGSTSWNVTRQHEAMLQLVLQPLQSDAHVVRKRAGTTLGCLSVVLSDALLVRMVESLLQQVDLQLSQHNTDVRALLRTLCTVSGAVGHRLGQAQLDRILPLFLKYCQPEDALTGDDDEEEDGDVDMDRSHMMEEDDNMSQEMVDATDDNRFVEDDAAVALQNELRESCFGGFESFVTRCPAQVEPHLETILQATLAYLSYDPNYSYGNDDEDEEEEENSDDDEDYSEEEEDMDDMDDEDDDSSWKVRRAAIRCLFAVVTSRQHQPASLWTHLYKVRRGRTSTVAGALVGRFKEREENCRVDVIDCFTRLLQVTVQASREGVLQFASSEDNTMVTDTTVVVDLRSEYGPALVKACETLLSIKKGGERSKASALRLLSTLCGAPGGIGGASEISSCLVHIQTFLTNGDGAAAGDGHAGFHHRETASKSLKLDALRLVRLMISCGNHNPVELRKGLLTTILLDVCTSVKEKWYKVIAEALRVLSQVPPIFVTGYDGSEEAATRQSEMDQVATSVFDAIEPLLAKHDVDQEIKECALAASGSLLSSLHTNLSSAQRGRLLQLLLERLRNETTRIVAIKTLSDIAAASDANHMDDANKIDLMSILAEAISSMASFLKQQSRSLKQSSLEALDIVVTHHGSDDASLQNGEMFSTVLQDVADLVVDSDLHLSHLSLRVSVSILKECPACADSVKTYILPKALELSTSPLLQDLALDSLLAFLEQMVVSNATDFSELFAALRQRCNDEQKLGKHSINNLALCLAVITAATSDENRSGVVKEMLSSLEGASEMTDDTQLQQVVLLLRLSGDLGRVVDMSQMDDASGRLLAIFMGCFEASSEDVKHAAAYALGRASFGAQTVFLPALVNVLETNKEKKQYLLLSALREFIRCNLDASADNIASSVPVIWPHLINHCGDSEEGVRTMVAECMGTLACLQPSDMLKRLRDLIAEHAAIDTENGHVKEGDDASKANALICWTASTAIKLAIAGKASASDLATYMPDYLKLLQQEELSVRNAALLMVYSAVHHMPQLVSGVMTDHILPSLNEVFALELKRKVDLGPFTHIVDDALPLRKSALSIFAKCLESLPGSLDIAAFMPVLAKALGDAEDVQLQAHQIVISMCSRQPTYLVAAVESFVEPLEKTLNKKTGSKTGTELERAMEWIKSALRATMALSHLDGTMNSRKFVDFMERVKNNAKFRPLLESLEE